jgi:hypothetical protein
MNINFQSTGLDTDWHYGFEDGKYVLKINPATHTNFNFKEACMFRAKELYDNLEYPALAIGGGIDAQIVLNCFYEQNLKIDCVFRHYVGYNDIEYEWMQKLQKKYNFNLIKVDIDANAIASEILQEFQNTKIHPAELIYKKFVSLLPNDMDVVQGFEGPIIVKGTNKLYYLESYNTYELLRRRAVSMLDRKGKFVSFEKTSNVLSGTLQEDIFQSFLDTYDYYAGHKFTTDLKSYLVDSWDMYVKTFVYNKYWKKDLMYFPKYQGSEGIKWMSGFRTFYRNRMVLIEMDHLKKFILGGGSDYKKFAEHSMSTIDPEGELFFQHTPDLLMLSEEL